MLKRTGPNYVWNRYRRVTPSIDFWPTWSVPNADEGPPANRGVKVPSRVLNHAIANPETSANCWGTRKVLNITQPVGIRGGCCGCSCLVCRALAYVVCSAERSIDAQVKRIKPIRRKRTPSISRSSRRILSASCGAPSFGAANFRVSLVRIDVRGPSSVFQTS